MIHSFDYPELAELRCRRPAAYAKIAPSAAHGCTCRRTSSPPGMWKESIDSNIGLGADGASFDRQTKLEQRPSTPLHATDYLEYAYLQTGQDAKGARAGGQRPKVTSFDVPQFAAGYALAAVPAATRSSAVPGRRPRH